MSGYRDTHCYLCGRYKNMDGTGHENCHIWSFRCTDGWLSLVHGYYDEINQMSDIEDAWLYLAIMMVREEIFIREYDIVCTCCGRNYLSDYNMPGECFTCSTVKEEPC